MGRTSIGLDERLRDYVQDVSLRDTDLLRRLRDETAQMPQASMQVAAEQGQFIGLLVRLIGARRCLEVGVFTGYSALCTALALPPDGRLVACDVSEEFTSVARRYWREAGLEDRIDLRLGPAADTLDALLAHGGAGTFDMCFIDADKASYARYYEQAMRLVRVGGLIAIDNVLWSGRVADPEVDDESTRAIREVTRLVGEDERVTMSILPIGDGMLLAVRLV